MIDTSVLYPNARGLPFKNALKYLSSKYLGKQIQTGAHDSCIDAATCMQLLKLKVKHGPQFGDERISDSEDGESIFRILHTPQRLCAMVDRPLNIIHYTDVTTKAGVACDADSKVIRMRHRIDDDVGI